MTTGFMPKTNNDEDLKETRKRILYVMEKEYDKTEAKKKGELIISPIKESKSELWLTLQKEYSEDSDFLDVEPKTESEDTVLEKPDGYMKLNMYKKEKNRMRRIRERSRIDKQDESSGSGRSGRAQ